MVNSRLSFARNLVVTENTQLRSSQPRQASRRYAQPHSKKRNKTFMKYFIILICITFLSSSCQKKIEIDSPKKEIDIPKKEDEVFTISQITTNYDTLIKRVKNKGNIDAYDELFYGFIDANETERTDSVMVYSKIMAEKFNYGNAYIDYFEAFGKKNNLKIDLANYSKIDISKLDEKTKKEATDWLKKMVKAKIITIEQYDSIKKQ